jgi:hypothetical protein
MKTTTKRERHLIYEGIAFGFTGLFGAFVIPELMSVRNSIAVVCGGLLFIGWLIWGSYFIYRAASK